MWDLPGPGLEPMFPALAGGFLTTAPPGKPCSKVFKGIIPLNLQNGAAKYNSYWHYRCHRQDELLFADKETLVPRGKTICPKTRSRMRLECWRQVVSVFFKGTDIGEGSPQKVRKKVGKNFRDGVRFIL